MLKQISLKILSFFLFNILIISQVYNCDFDSECPEYYICFQNTCNKTFFMTSCTLDCTDGCCISKFCRVAYQKICSTINFCNNNGDCKSGCCINNTCNFLSKCGFLEINSTCIDKLNCKSKCCMNSKCSEANSCSYENIENNINNNIRNLVIIGVFCILLLIVIIVLSMILWQKTYWVNMYVNELEDEVLIINSENLNYNKEKDDYDNNKVRHISDNIGDEFEDFYNEKKIYPKVINPSQNI